MFRDCLPSTERKFSIYIRRTTGSFEHYCSAMDVRGLGDLQWLNSVESSSNNRVMAGSYEGCSKSFAT